MSLTRTASLEPGVPSRPVYSSSFSSPLTETLSPFFTKLATDSPRLPQKEQETHWVDFRSPKPTSLATRKLRTFSPLWVCLNSASLSTRPPTSHIYTLSLHDALPI